jgi:F0F1-type ATP synthase delta subunit
LDEIQKFAREQGGSLPLDFSTVQQALKDAGLAPEVLEFLKAVYSKGLLNDFDAIVSDFNGLYNAFFNISYGTIILGEAIPAKYANYLNKIKFAAAGTLAEDNSRVHFNTEVCVIKDGI